MEPQMDWFIEAQRGDEWVIVESLRGFTPEGAERRLRTHNQTELLPVWRLRPAVEER